MRRVRRIAIALGVIVALLVLLLVFGIGTSQSRYRKIATELVELDRQWETNVTNVPSLYESLTNLPFHHHGEVLVGKGCVSRRYTVLGMGWEQYYFIYQPVPVTNASEWALYHAWYWYQPGGGKRQLTTHKLVTITTN
jgi:hypothetical protein